MNRQAFTPVLLLLALLSVAYAVYRSAAETITVNDGARQTVYGAPQHGLILGLFIFAGVCVVCSVILSQERGRDVLRRDEPAIVSKRPL